MKLDHILLPCKMSSTRILRKNLQIIRGKTLLENAIERYSYWYPEATIWVATEDKEAAAIASRRGCKIYPLTEEDVTDRRDASGLLYEWLEGRRPSDRCILSQITSPFTFRSELEMAISDPRPYLQSAWIGKLHLFPVVDCGTLYPKSAPAYATLSQLLPLTACCTGNFIAVNGRYRPSPSEEVSQWSSVSWLSAIDINTHDDLVLAQRIGECIPLEFWNDENRFQKPL